MGEHAQLGRTGRSRGAQGDERQSAVLRGLEFHRHQSLAVLEARRRRRDQRRFRHHLRRSVGDGGDDPQAPRQFLLKHRRIEINERDLTRAQARQGQGCDEMPRLIVHMDADDVARRHARIRERCRRR